MPRNLIRSASFLVSFFLLLQALTAQVEIRVEAEEGALAGTSISTDPAGFSGSGYVSGFSTSGDSVTMTFELPQAGVYQFSIGYRTPNGEKGFAGTLNGLGFSGMFPLSATFAEIEVGKVVLAAGINTVVISGGWNYYQIDYVRFTPDQPYASALPIHPLPVNSSASDATRWLYAYLLSNYGNQAISGQHGIHELDYVYGLTGEKPMILSEDLIEYTPSRVAHGSDPGQLTESLIAKASEGHIISLCWHWNAPSGLLDTEAQPWWSGFYTRATTFDLEAALADEEGTDYQLLLRDIDTIAVELLKLKEANIPVLWRPLHESDGGWFWWGAKGAKPFKALWRILYNRLTVTHGLNNLIWVLTFEDLAWYPGDDVVDIIGVDAYPDDVRDTLASKWQAMFERFDGKKMIALTEFGGVPDLPAMQLLGIRWAYFASWQGDLGARHNPIDEVVRIYQDSNTLNLEDLTAFRTTPNWGDYPVIDGIIDTGTWLGRLEVNNAPILYSQLLQRSIFLPKKAIQPQGNWLYIYP